MELSDPLPLETLPRGGHPCLQMDTSSGESLVLPWHQMILARLNSTGTELTVKFGCGDAVIAGMNLKEVRDALQRQSAARLGPGSEAGGKLVITSVVFKELKAGNGAEDGEGEDEEYFR